MAPSGGRAGRRRRRHRGQFLICVDVWESKEAFEQFAQEKIGDSMAQAGYTEQPEIMFSEVHNYLYGG